MLSKFRILLLGIACGLSTYGKAQVVGGQFSFEFLRLSSAAHTTALGGIAIADPSEDMGLVDQNPSLMRPSLHNQLAINRNNYYNNIAVNHFQYGYHSAALQTSFALGIHTFNYGNTNLTDDIGNIYATFQPNASVISISASKSYETKWRYGAQLKYANLQLINSRANAVLMDVGVTYTDTAKLLNIAFVAKNMGFYLHSFETKSALPFDLQIAISQRLAHLPVRLMATIHHLYEWDIRYNNPADIVTSSFLGSTNVNANKSYFADKLFRHFIFGANIYLHKKFTASVAYNHLRRGELGLKDAAGMAGFSFGFMLDLEKMQFNYARNYTSTGNPYTEIGLNINLQKFAKISSLSKIHWNTAYANEYWNR
jgi:hypothetical protein